MRPTRTQAIVADASSRPAALERARRRHAGRLPWWREPLAHRSGDGAAPARGAVMAFVVIEAETGISRRNPRGGDAPVQPAQIVPTTGLAVVLNTLGSS